uniref:Uncharacterized protein n=1 Tax=Providencia alcalifaciens TaxID=126385 RepID=H7C8G5_9GAMM|nr:hypothetical protein [Providencia alcalifaciens]
MIVMKRLQAFKFQLRSNEQQERPFCCQSGVSGFKKRITKQETNISPTQRWLHGSLNGNLTQRHNG